MPPHGPLSTSQPIQLVVLSPNDQATDTLLQEMKAAGMDIHADVVGTLAAFRDCVSSNGHDAILAVEDGNERTLAAALDLMANRRELPFIITSKAQTEDSAIAWLNRGATECLLRRQRQRLPFALRRALRETRLRQQHEYAIHALKESEQRFREMVEACPDPIFVHCAESIVFANAACMKLMGAETRSQLLGKTVAEITHPDFLDAVKQRIQRNYQTGTASVPLEHRALRLDGFVVEVEAVGIPVTWNGEPAMEVLMRDITERKRVQQAALEWSRRRELAEKAAGVGFWEWDVTRDQLSWSSGMYRQAGLSPESFKGKRTDLLSHIHPDDRQRAQDAMAAALDGSGEYDVELRVIRPDGSTPWLHSRGAVIRNGTGPRLIGITIDITDIKNAHQALRESEAKYRNIVEHAPYGVCRVAPDGRILMANPGLARILGYSSENELLSLDLGHDVYGAPKKREEIVAQVLAGGSSGNIQLEWRRKDGSPVNVCTHGSVIRNDAGVHEGCLLFVEDVTERKDLERRFWQAQKMEAVGRLAGGIAHDFNNVLMIISSYADLILQRESDDEKLTRYAEHIQQAALKAAGVTQQLLAYSRRQMLEPEVLGLNHVVTDLQKILPQLMGENIEVLTELDDTLEHVRVDRGQMEQILMNLAVNARDAMPRGGKFVIQTRNVIIDETYAAQHLAITPGHYVMLSVTDTGMGMSPQTKARIFDPFFTTKERGKGTGLGLAAVYGIVKQSGGYIWVYSELGRGTTFKIYLPQIDKPVKPAILHDPADIHTEGLETILLVEDEAGLRSATRAFLESKGYTVIEAGSGLEALRRCNHDCPTLDAIVTDLVMPGMDGIEMAGAIKALYPNVRVVYMSGYTERVVEGLGNGKVLLQKPFTLHELAHKLRELFDRDSESIANPRNGIDSLVTVNPAAEKRCSRL